MFQNIFTKTIDEKDENVNTDNINFNGKDYITPLTI